MDDRALFITPKCELCGAELVINNYVLYFKQEKFIIEAECINCGEKHYDIIEMTDFIDIESEFWIAYYKKLPPQKGVDDDKKNQD